MSRVMSTVRDALRRRPSPDGRLLLAVSGGADSVALLRAVVTLREELAIEPAVVHVNHALRGADSDLDAAWVAQLGARLGVPVEIEQRDVAASAAARSIGIEEAARDARYTAYRDVARRLDIRVVAVAHTADDQAETILHHILRGTGLSGLRGMPSERSLDDRLLLIRPMLEVRRSEVEAWLHQLGQDFRADATNRDTAFTRNRIRHELLPHLREAYNPQVVEALLRLGRQAHEADHALRALAAQALDRALLVSEDVRIGELDCGALSKSPRHVVRQCFVELWTRRGWPRQSMTAEHWDRLAALVVSDAADGAGSAVTLPGPIDARRRRQWLVLRWK